MLCSNATECHARAGPLSPRNLLSGRSFNAHLDSIRGGPGATFRRLDKNRQRRCQQLTVPRRLANEYGPISFTTPLQPRVMMKSRPAGRDSDGCRAAVKDVPRRSLPNERGARHPRSMGRRRRDTSRVTPTPMRCTYPPRPVRRGVRICIVVHIHEIAALRVRRQIGLSNRETNGRRARGALPRSALLCAYLPPQLEAYAACRP